MLSSDIYSNKPVCRFGSTTIWNTALREKLLYVTHAMDKAYTNQGFDEFMNVTLQEAEEVPCGPGRERKSLGMCLSLKMWHHN